MGLCAIATVMMNDDFQVGKQRREIEDSIVARFDVVNFKQKKHAYLEDEVFWDFVFSWYELVRYYEFSQDATVGAHMLDLYTQCVQVFRAAASDRKLRERRRDKAADAIYQMTYYVDRLLKQAERNGIERESALGNLDWAPNQPTADDTPNLN